MGLSFTTAAGPHQGSHSQVPSPAGHMTIFYSLRFETPSTWRARSSHLYPPGIRWPSYTPKYWAPFSSPPTTFRATVEVFGPAFTRAALSQSQLFYAWRFTANQFVLARSPLRPTTSNFIFQLVRERVCRLQLLMALASAVILRPESRGTHDHILQSQIRDSLNLEGQVVVFIVFTAPLTITACLFLFHYCGFQPSCHIILQHPIAVANGLNLQGLS
jgi:hypothetical protein